jgi:SAM-dependent MidA family methyltransferase
MTPAGEIIAAEIRERGSIAFSRFMEIALYHPEHGYYVTPRDPFGKEGDFYTASQLQPVFGRLVACALRQCRAALGEPPGFTVVEWGAGRGEMAPSLSEFPYFAVDFARGRAPLQFEGVVFSNELFDALPVDVVRIRDGAASRMNVALEEGRFVWRDAGPLPPEWRDYAHSLLPHFRGEPEVWLELPVRLGETLSRMCAPLSRGCVIAVDYGYTARELVRFPRGTLMSYRKHSAIDDVLRDPGLQDITAHVAFTHLEDMARTEGLKTGPLETLAQFLLRAGEADQFASALQAESQAEAARLRLQLKSLLFGMGETFRVVTLHKEGPAPKS